MAYETYTVKKGDSLWSIAAAKLGSGSKWKQLARLNNISEKYPLIRVGQVIKIDVVNDKPETVKKKNNTNAPKISNFGLQSDSDNTVFATWIWTKSNTDNYRVVWYYDTGDGVWFVGSDSTVDIKQSTYSIPLNAHRVRFKVKPIAKKHKVNNKETAYWTANWSTIKEYNVKNNPPSTPSGLSADIEKNKLTAKLNNISGNATHIQFQVVGDDAKVYKTGMSEITKAHASFSCTVLLGYSYKVRCRAYRSKDKKYSDWSEYTDNITTIPSTPKNLVFFKTLSETAVQITWEKSSTNNVTGYEIQYTTKKYYFDSSNEVQSMSLDISIGHAEITGLNSGEKYYCRVRAKNDKGTSGWTDIISFITGKKPAAPTTWSSTTTVTTGESVNLYWVHNSEDESSQTYAELELIIDGVKTITTIKNSTNEDEKDKTSVKTLSTSEYNEGCEIKWRVRTAGITKKYGDWSVQRIINVYASPTLQIEIIDYNLTTIEPENWETDYLNYYTKSDGGYTKVVGDTAPVWVENTYYYMKSRYSPDNDFAVIDSFPFYISAVSGPDTQEPIGYHVDIISNSAYETVDNIGNEKIVSKDESVYSKNFDIKDDLLLEMTPVHLSIENNQDYTLKISVSMDSGLITDSSMRLLTQWADEEYQPEVTITTDPDALIAYIKPSCKVQETTMYKVTNESGIYSTTTEVIDYTTEVLTASDDVIYIGLDSDGNVIYYIIEYRDDEWNEIPPRYRLVENHSSDSAYITDIIDPSTIHDIYTSDTNKKVILGILPDGTEGLYCEIEEDILVSNVSLSVYRREFDGSFTEIASNLDNTSETYVVDPHPALDYARYRIIATDNYTGTISYYDPPGEPIDEKSAVIQWNEEWSDFVASTEDALEQPPWSGSMVKLPYNLDVSDKYSPDVSLVTYIGRENPVSYYGTQIGQTQSWNVVIDKEDGETLYILRKLAIYMGDVYIREPSGSGYWANIKVSFSQTHLEVTIPISIEITRVEGGI